MRDKPNSCYLSGCPLAVTCQCGHLLDLHKDDSNCGYVHPETSLPCKCNEFRSKGKGFVLGCGDPSSAKLALIFEAPGKDELQFRLMPVQGRSFYSTQAEVNAEILRRQQKFPDMEGKYVKLGVPTVGATWTELDMWVLPRMPLTRSDLYIDNTLRCLPPKKANGAYPTGDEKKAAEKACRMYDRLDEFKPDVGIVTLHPAGILREVTPLPLQIKDMEKARDFVNAGLRPLVFMGGKASEAFLRHASNVTRWRGHYEFLAPDWTDTYRSLFEFKVKVKRKPGPVKGAKAAAEKASQMAESFRKLDHLFNLSPNLPSVKRRRRKHGDEDRLTESKSEKVRT